MELKTRRDLVKQVSEIAGSVGVPADKVEALLQNGTGEAHNRGNAVSNNLKLAIKLGRQNGIHVSPTVLFDGLQDNAVSSSWELPQWEEYFQSKL